MRVLLINGSPRKEGCTFTALCEVAGALQQEGIETEIFHIGREPVSGCLACGGCRKGEGCVIDDVVNVAAERCKTADGFIFGAPVHYAASSGMSSSFFDRLFYSHKCFAHKPGAAVVTCRRAGATASLDRLNKYFTINQMPVVSSTYWNMVHGNTPDEVRQDLEGMQIMRNLGHNMAWLLKCIEAGKQAGIDAPSPESPRLHTNFIR